jgi:hypothetical protein
MSSYIKEGEDGEDWDSPGAFCVRRSITTVLEFRNSTRGYGCLSMQCMTHRSFCNRNLSTSLKPAHAGYNICLNT